MIFDLLTPFKRGRVDDGGGTGTGRTELKLRPYVFDVSFAAR